jgi:hypothetical protein
MNHVSTSRESTVSDDRDESTVSNVSRNSTVSNVSRNSTLSNVSRNSTLSTSSIPNSMITNWMARDQERERQIMTRMGIIWLRPQFTITHREVLRDLPDSLNNVPNRTVVKYTFRNGDIVTGVESQIRQWLIDRVRSEATSFHLRAEGNRHRIIFQRSNRRPRSEEPVQIIDID